MSDRRPSLWKAGHDNDELDDCQTLTHAVPASPADLLAAVRRGVESGTIKGEVRQWCEVHGYTESHLYGEECEYAYHHRPSTLCRFVESTIITGRPDGGEA